ncbi:MAG: glycosyltransferase family 2 protein [Bacteroidales bacterium]|nr:glycosyltransferase family 2 protein [Bacteroidales bacterium]MDE6439533.1 glycosyltransferase family 2 protein [Bacteroidales bacterium]
MKKKISIITACYNEEENVAILCERIRAVMQTLPQYDYEHIFIDNASKDRTVELIRQEIAADSHIRCIVNARNFGHIRSPFHGMCQCYGDAVIAMASDLQDPPETIPELVARWEEGYKVVIGVKNQSKENPLMFGLRKLFYNLLAKASETEQVKNFTGFGLYDRQFMDVLRGIDDPYPYFRGLVAELGFERAEVPFVQPKRERGRTHNNFYTLYDMAMLGFVNHSKLPLRLASFLGFGTAIVSLLVAIVYFIYKLVYWENFSVGQAPLVIGLFFFSAVQLFFIGIIGEYVGAIHTQVRKRPLVIEKERINFD